jgi:hypothetical protein
LATAATIQFAAGRIELLAPAHFGLSASPIYVARIPAAPFAVADGSTNHARQITAQSPIQILIQEQPHLTRGDRVLSCFFQQRDDLFPLHTGKSFQELLDGIARLQMIKQTLYRDTRPGKNRFATEDLRILRHDPREARPFGS